MDMFYVFLFLAIIASVTLGAVSMHYYNLITTNHGSKLYGVWLNNISALSKYDGSFICVNIDETKTLAQLETVCEHEVGHEIFARECENNFTKCLEVEK